MTRDGEDGAAVRILADDLTGALDAAGPFATNCGCVAVYWDAARATADARPRVALDAATREAGVDVARSRTRAASRALWSARPGLAFKKVDSVWRGNPSAEIAAAFVEGAFDRVIVAPAFPQQGRVTRQGGQWVAEGGRWRCVVADIAAELRGAGLAVVRECDAAPTEVGIVCDAAGAEDLAAIVARYRPCAGRTLWCGTRGLAHALAERLAPRPKVSSPPSTPPAPLRAPVLFVVGTDHPVSTGQADALSRCPDVACITVDTATREAYGAGSAVPRAFATLLRFDVPPGTTREDARDAIAHALHDRVASLAPPGLLVATGGETVRALGDALGASCLDVYGEYEPGIPIAAWGDGRWAGTPVLSKSGGFGTPDLFTRVLASVAGPRFSTGNSR